MMSVLRVLTLLTSLVLASCAPSETPTQVAEGYLTALAKPDFEEASRYVTDEGKANFQYLKKSYEGLGPEEQSKFQITGWTVGQESVTGDSATVDFLFDQTKKGQLSLRLIQGHWKVDHRQTF